MKNYFESQTHIVPFVKVIDVYIDKDDNIIQVTISNDTSVQFPIEQVYDYVAWLESQQENVLLNVFENINQQILNTEQLKQEKLTGSDRLPDVRKKVLTKEVIQFMLKNGFESSCENCIRIAPTKEGKYQEYDCQCDKDYEPTDRFVAEINGLWDGK